MPAAWQSVIDAVCVSKIGFIHQDVNKGKKLCYNEIREVLKTISKGTRG